MIDASQIRLGRYRFPGRAGALQAYGAAAPLLAELGENYAAYHEHVADELERHGGFPDPRRFAGDFDGYAAAMDYAVDLVRAEQLLRIAHAWREEGVEPGEPRASAGVPLLDERHRLVDRSDDRSKRSSRRGNPRAAAWQPPAPPRIMDLGS
jgi:hypothetical protein